MKILAIEKVPRARERVTLRLEDGTEIEIAREILLRAGLREEAAVSVARLQELIREDLDWRVREAALRLLSHRPRTESELRLRLNAKGFPAAVVDACLVTLRARGLLDDAAFAEMFARDRVRLNPRGRRLVLQELRGRGVEAETASDAVEAVMQEESVDELELARDAARRWRPRQEEDPARARRRLAGYLARRGFGPDATRQVVEETLGES